MMLTWPFAGHVALHLVEIMLLMMLFLSFSNLYHFHELYVDYTTQNTRPPISMARLCGLFDRMAAARMQPATAYDTCGNSSYVIWVKESYKAWLPLFHMIQLLYHALVHRFQDPMMIPCWSEITIYKVILSD